MHPEILSFLSEMVSEILRIVGVSYIPLIVLILFRAGSLRGLMKLSTEEKAERLGDLCFDTIKEKINNKIEELLQLYYHNALVLPPGRSIQDIACYLHQAWQTLEVLLTI